jgi:hypothetical protein
VTVGADRREPGSHVGAAAGDQTVSAQYGGDGSFAGSLSAGSTLTVTQSSATVSLTGGASSLVTGQSITFSATVAAPSGNALAATALIGSPAAVFG